MREAIVILGDRKGHNKWALIDSPRLHFSWILKPDFLKSSSRS
jgi:hypothetical protein